MARVKVFYLPSSPAGRHLGQSSPSAASASPSFSSASLRLFLFLLRPPSFFFFFFIPLRLVRLCLFSRSSKRLFALGGGGGGGGVGCRPLLFISPLLLLPFAGGGGRWSRGPSGQVPIPPFPLGFFFSAFSEISHLALRVRRFSLDELYNSAHETLNFAIVGSRFGSELCGKVCQTS